MKIPAKATIGAIIAVKLVTFLEIAIHIRKAVKVAQPIKIMLAIIFVDLSISSGNIILISKRATITIRVDRAGTKSYNKIAKIVKREDHRYGSYFVPSI